MRLLTFEEIEKYEKKLKKYTGEGLYVDYEKTHMQGDKILCEVLTKMGYKSIVRIFMKIRKWYS